MLTPDVVFYSETLRRTVARRKSAMVITLIMNARYRRNGDAELVEAVMDLTGVDLGSDLTDWMEWQPKRPEIKTFGAFDAFKAVVFGGIDPNYARLLWCCIKHEVHMEEVVWSGVKAINGMPSFDFLKHITASETDYLNESVLVFGVAINGDVRAYALRCL
jgi:hypothetical protein